MYSQRDPSSPFKQGQTQVQFTMIKQVTARNRFQFPSSEEVKHVGGLRDSRFLFAQDSKNFPVPFTWMLPSAMQGPSTSQHLSLATDNIPGSGRAPRQQQVGEGMAIEATFLSPSQYILLASWQDEESGFAPLWPPPWL